VNVDDDFVTYKAALVNPFSYVRAAEMPDAQLLSDIFPELPGDVDPTGMVEES
jgi:hypothetical protein